MKAKVSSIIACALVAGSASAGTLSPDVTVPVDATNTLSMRVWVPDGVVKVRGVIVACHPSGTGPPPAFQQDYRPLANDTPSWSETTTTEWDSPNRSDLALQLVAKRHAFAFIGLYFSDQKPGGAGTGHVDMMDSHAAALEAGISQCAVAYGRPELATAPICTFGFSGGGGFSAYYAAYNPSRCIAFANNKGGSIGDYDPAALAPAVPVPAMLCYGELDTTNRIHAIRATFATYRANGALWCLLPDYGLAHESQGYGRFLAAAFFDRVIERRLPRDWVPGTAPSLLALTEDSGWLGDNTTWESGAATIVSFPASGADLATRRTQSWLPDRHLAEAWRSAATHLPPAKLSSPVSALPTTQPAQLAFLSSGGSQLLGIQNPTGAVSAVEWKDGDTAVQTVAAAPFSMTLSGVSPGFHLMHGELQMTGGVSRTSDLAILLVKPPAPNQAPTLLSGPSPIGDLLLAGLPVACTVRAADPDGSIEELLSYAWSATGPGTVTFGPGNGANAGKDITATFPSNATYTLSVTVTDAHGATASASTNLAVRPLYTGHPPPTAFDLGFSTYFGGNSFDMGRDVCVDHQGNIIIVGGTASTNFPTTAGVYSRTLQTGGLSLGKQGVMDVFVAKFTPAGQLMWSTYFGGPNYDRAYAVEVDQQDRIFVAGRAGEGLPTTPGAFQTHFIDTFTTTILPSQDEYGKQNGFVACLSPTGQLIWDSYVFYGSLCRDVDVDDLGDVYLTSGWNGNGPQPPPFASGYRRTPVLPGGGNAWKSAGDSCVIKVKGDGTQMLWGTWLCGSGDETLESMVRVDGSRGVYFANLTKSTDMPTPGNGDRTHNGGGYDYYLARLSPGGTNLIYGTYVGGNGNENLDTHQLAVDAQGNAYLALLTPSPDLPVTPGAFQPGLGGLGDVALCKVGPDGGLLRCTYLGGSEHEIVEGLSIDPTGNLYVTGATRSPDFPVAGTPFQATYGPEGPFDATTTAAWNGFLTVVAADFTELSYSSFMGKQCILIGQNAVGGFHANVLAPDGSFILVGSWVTDNFPVTNAYQSVFLGGATPTTSVLYTKHCDGVLAKFVTPGNHSPRILAWDPATPFEMTPGDTQAFRLEALDDDGDPLTYAWQLDGVPTGDAGTNMSYRPVATDAGVHSIVATVSDGRGGMASQAWSITVMGPPAPPSITTQPLDRSVAIGQRATFSVTATGAAPLSYRWRKRAANISYAASAIYVTPRAVTDDSGATFSVVVSNALGSVTSAVATLTVLNASYAPVGHWRLDETAGLSAVDASGNGGTGGLLNMAGSAWGPGACGGALRFDGVDDAVRVADSDVLDITNTYTLAAWVNPRTFGEGGWGRILSKGDASGARYHLLVTGGRLALNVSAEEYSSAGLIRTGVWQHVAVSYDGATVRMYKDGLPDISRAASLAPGINTNALYIGNVRTGVRTFDGLIDDVRIYNRALTAGEVAALHSPDMDGDGMPDPWEAANFGGTNAMDGGAADDWDDDGMVNLDECAAGTSPTNAASKVQVSTLSLQDGAIAICFQTEAGRTYTVRHRDDLVLGDWGVLAPSNVPGTGAQATITDTNKPLDHFYRLKVERE